MKTSTNRTTYIHVHLCGLAEAALIHILGTFPLVPELVKVAVHNAYRGV